MDDSELLSEQSGFWRNKEMSQQTAVVSLNQDEKSSDLLPGARQVGVLWVKGEPYGSLEQRFSKCVQSLDQQYQPRLRAC